ncbi:uncharacterized protein STEHIDRAFT_86036 [Stereum hirsutum FP-91666 SS1]|uniref:uncharacterized protein n=1 Tax=Stereum hirsutum (strain FP-91666) TaxID=721885 RepID=UPI000444A590|nr:uncharacterized protein STEHIDRAFT_86036 [Stereum hirsutum FP-91666 SS1]EIM81653.1 hypothetical protein STEHIDRAFT_86036 [Stereum hirsutum FP-91666 SS1]
MGYTLPSPTSPAERVRTLIARKENIEAEIDAQLSILQTNGITDMRAPLVDAEGFPRADIDVWNVRQARVRIIELRNDLDSLMGDIGKALEGVYSPTVDGQASEPASSSKPDAAPASKDETMLPSDEELLPFAKVNGVAPGSPAADAGLLRDDLVVKFGHLHRGMFTGSALQPLASLVAANENKEISVLVRRGEEGNKPLKFTPRQGWGGRGMLGCHIVPYSS